MMLFELVPEIPGLSDVETKRASRTARLRAEKDSFDVARRRQQVSVWKRKQNPYCKKYGEDSLPGN